MSRASLQKDPGEVSTMFDDIASTYDMTNDLLSMGQVRRWRKIVVQTVAALPGHRVLDVAAGTGSSSEPYANAGVDVISLDFSRGMLKVGKRRRPDLNFVAGDAMALPFAANTFDATTISFGLRNVRDPRLALTEMCRVTKPGGRVVIAEFSHPHPEWWRKIYTQYLTRALPFLARGSSLHPEAYAYLTESIHHWPNQDQLAHWMREAGWSSVTYRNLQGGLIALHRGFKLPQ